jgi:hypothetical protein
MSASAVIADVRSLLAGEPVFLAGSLVAAETYAMAAQFHDVDLFCPTNSSLMATGQRLLSAGFKLDDRMERTWYRWRKYGFNKWHTNSLRLNSPTGEEWNVIYKQVDGHPTTSLSQVLESFDFGLLATGYDLESDQFMDLRSYLFPVEFTSPFAPLPLMPNKRSNWRRGFISKYNGLREAGRYAKYADYGYDLTLVKDDLITGYREADLYLSGHFDPQKQLLGRIYSAIADHISFDNVDELRAASKQLNLLDNLDQIMEALE